MLEHSQNCSNILEIQGSCPSFTGKCSQSFLFDSNEQTQRARETLSCNNNVCKQILSVDELEVTIEGRQKRNSALFIEILLSIFTFGLYYIVRECNPKVKTYVITRCSQLKECGFVFCTNSHKQLDLVPVEVLEDFNNLRAFKYRCITFVFDAEHDSFIASNQLVDISDTSLGEAPAGITKSLHSERIALLGSNKIGIPLPSILNLLRREVLQPMNIFQFASFIIWAIQEYWKYASVILVITIGSIILTVRDMRRSLRKIKEMSAMDLDVYVNRNSNWRVVSYEDLVPGDVFELTSTLTTVPCDCVILDGDCIMDESMLTGESIPVSKISPEDDDDWELIDFSHLESSRSTRSILFCGTRIIRVRGSHSRPAIAMVLRTGWFTSKGSLIRSILFPKPNNFKFYEESVNFIKMLSVVAVLGSITVVIYTWKDIKPAIIFKRATDLITVVVPPALPAAMAVGTEFALRRLKKQRVFCISPPKINVAGKLTLLCFDKTGTLTEEGLDVMGIHANNALCMIKHADISKSAPEHSLTENPKSNLVSSVDKLVNGDVILALATCHSIKSVNDEFIGDPLDLKMFEWTKWILEESSHTTNSVVSSIVRPPWSSEFDVDEFLYPDEDENEDSNEIHPSKQPYKLNTNSSLSMQHLEYGIIRCFEFISQLRRMSVIVRELNENDLKVFTKGSPESILPLLTPESIPVSYQDTLDHYTHCGYRVIALAYKNLPGVSWIQVQKMARATVEAELVFLGFLVFENKIKPVTKSVLSTLRSADIRTLMCTGDNVLTAISVGRECGIVADKDDMLIFTSRLDEAAGKIEWIPSQPTSISVNPTTLRLDRSTQFKLSPNDSTALSTSLAYELACTGDVFDYLLEHNPEIFEKLLVKCQIFARMNPDQKQVLVENLQSLGYSVGFCGDGANDCGALKAADVGISLSEAEASVAAPFTSNINDIGCVLNVLKEGRCSLQTSFACFKLMSLYVFVQFITSILLNFKIYRLGDNQFLYIDLALNLMVAFANDTFRSSPTLTRAQPCSKLFSLKFLSELTGHFLVIAAFQIGVFIWTVKKDPAIGSGDDFQSLLVTRLFLFSIFQYLIVGLVSCPGAPFRQPVCTHWLYCGTMLSELLINGVLLFVENERIDKAFDFVKITPRDRKVIAVISLVNALFAVIVELVVPVLVLFIRRMQRHKHTVKKWQSIEQELIRSETA